MSIEWRYVISPASISQKGLNLTTLAILIKNEPNYEVFLTLEEPVKKCL